MTALYLLAFAAAQSPSAGSQQPIDSAYTEAIRELTPTHPRWKFTTELVDHLPASETVPTPLAVLGYVPGTVGRLSHVADVHRYFRALADASPRVKLFSLGPSDEGREVLLAAIADQASIERLEEYREMLVRLTDPRSLPAGERERLIQTAKPVYWLTGAIHSPETGSPEMLMELAYRLAVGESDHLRSIRENVITLITPILEVDGRDRIVDTYRLAKELGLGVGGVPLVYWGKYVAHDNNRDGMVLSQQLTRNYMKGFLHWRPTVGHDLHESVPFLYTSTGTGPYNEEFDPIQVNEWHQLAYQEINELTRRGLPGVWTHGFFDGWAPNYVLAIANLHNSVGKFYETYTSMGAECHTVNLGAQQTSRIWYRTNPPVNGVRWCIRSNINYQQSGVLIALKYVADNRATFLESAVTKAERMIAKGRTQPPYAYLIPRGQRRAAEAADLVNLFREQGIEVHEAAQDRSFRKAPGSRRDTAMVRVAAGDWIIRMDQPYTQTVRTVLAIQSFRPEDPRPYDDTGWTLDRLRHVESATIADSAVLAAPMRLLASDAVVAGVVRGSGAVLLVPHLGDWRSALLPWKLAGRPLEVATARFTQDGTEYAAGTWIVPSDTSAVAAIGALGLRAVAIRGAPAVPRRRVTVPRIALIHTWRETQNEGWVRYTFDRLGVPYTTVSDQRLREPGLLESFDVTVFPHVSGSLDRIVNGLPMVGPPIPWKRTELTPHLGRIDATEDIRPGMGLDGAEALRRFVSRGGLLLVEGTTSRLPIDLFFTPGVRVVETRNLQARGGVFLAQAEAPESPLLYGYESASFPVYFSQAPVLAVERPDTAALSRGRSRELVAAENALRPRAVLQFHRNVDSVLVSGLLAGGSELAGRAAVVDAPLGKGHVIYFGIRPFWRWQTQGSFALALNAIAHWDGLREGNGAVLDEAR